MKIKYQVLRLVQLMDDIITYKLCYDADGFIAEFETLEAAEKYITNCKTIDTFKIDKVYFKT